MAKIRERLATMLLRSADRRGEVDFTPLAELMVARSAQEDGGALPGGSAQGFTRWLEISRIGSLVPEHYDGDWARKLPAVGAAIDAISWGIATLPFKVYDVNSDGEEEEVPQTDPEAMILTRRWGNFITAMDGVQHFIESCMIDGHGAAYLERPSPGAFPVAIHPLDPGKIKRQLVGDEIEYRAILRGTSYEPVNRDDLFFLPFKRPRNGYSDRSPLARYWPSVRAALAATMFSAWYFDRGALPSTVYSKKDDDGEIKLKRETSLLWYAEDRMRREGRRSFVIPPGWLAQKLGGNPEESKLDESRTFGVQEIARIYGIPPTILMDLSRGTFSNYGQQRFALGETLDRWAMRLCAEFSNLLWPEGNRICRIDTSLAIREPFNLRMQGYRTAVEAGIKTRNEIRIMEGDPPMDQEGADELQINSGPTFMLPMPGDLGDDDDDDSADDDPDDDADDSDDQDDGDQDDNDDDEDRTRNGKRRWRMGMMPFVMGRM